MDTDFQIGDVVKSISGHDKNRLFLVVYIDKSGYLAIIDGKYREKQHPKLKNPKHVIKICHDKGLIEKYNSKIVTDKEMYHLITSKIKEKE